MKEGADGSEISALKVDKVPENGYNASGNGGKGREDLDDTGRYQAFLGLGRDVELRRFRKEEAV